MTKEYRKSLSEIKMIFEYMDSEEVQKIPEKILSFINNNYDKEYHPNIDRDIPLDRQAIKKDTKTLLSIFYRYYWCESEERSRLLEEDKKALEVFQQQMKQSYRLEETLENQRSKTSSVEEIRKVTQPKEEVQLVSSQKPKWYQKIFDKISAIFKK